MNNCTDNNRLSSTMDLAFEAVCKVGLEADKKSFQCNVGKTTNNRPFSGPPKISKKRINNLHVE